MTSYCWWFDSICHYAYTTAYLLVALFNSSCVCLNIQIQQIWLPTNISSPRRYKSWTIMGIFLFSLAKFQFWLAYLFGKIILLIKCFSCISLLCKYWCLFPNNGVGLFYNHDYCTHTRVHVHMFWKGRVQTHFTNYPSQPLAGIEPENSLIG